MKNTRYNAAITLTGIALVAGFFLPWLSFGWFGLSGISGWDVVWHDEGDYLARLALLSVPVLGSMMAFAGIARSRKAANLSVLVGMGILGYTFLKLAWAVLATTGIGLWLVLGGAAAAVVFGIRAQRGPINPKA